MNVPMNFVVPKDSTWPANLHGYNMGTVLRSIRYKGALPDCHAQLESIGFRINIHDHKFTVFMIALELFKKLNQNTLVPRDFIVPHNAPWPEECWGCKLGRKVKTTRAGT